MDFHSCRRKWLRQYEQEKINGNNDDEDDDEDNDVNILDVHDKRRSAWFEFWFS